MCHSCTTDIRVLVLDPTRLGDVDQQVPKELVAMTLAAERSAEP